MRSHSRLVLNAFACVIASAASVHAQTHESEIPALIGGRPGSVENRGTVGTGVLQLEGGFALDFNPGEESAPRKVTTPGGVIRFGLTKQIEARVGGKGFQYSSANVDGGRVGSHGASDLYVGAKMVVLNEHRAGFEFSVVPGVSLPTGSETLSSTGYDPSVTFAFARELPFRFDAVSAWKIASPTIEHEHHREFEGSVAAGRPLTSRIGVGAEVGRRQTWQESPVWFAGTGVAFRVAGDVQADVQMGRDLREGAGWTVGAGLVVRVR
jgi:hypothetical protein